MYELKNKEIEEKTTKGWKVFGFFDHSKYNFYFCDKTLAIDMGEM